MFLPAMAVLARTDQRSDCVNNLRQIDGAKEQLQLEEKLLPSDAVDVAKLASYIKGGFPKCASGGVYTIGAFGVEPTCSIRGHSMAYNERSIVIQSRYRVVFWSLIAAGGFVVVGWRLLKRSKKKA